MAELWRRLGREPPAILSTGLRWGRCNRARRSSPGRHSSRVRWRALRAGQTSNRSWRGGAIRLRSTVSPSPGRVPGRAVQRTNMISPA